MRRVPHPAFYEVQLILLCLFSFGLHSFNAKAETPNLGIRCEVFFTYPNFTRIYMVAGGFIKAICCLASITWQHYLAAIVEGRIVLRLCKYFAITEISEPV